MNRTLASLAAADVRLQEAYDTGRDRYGDLDFEWEAYLAHICSICSKNMGSDSSQEQILTFVHSLHADDLYLSLGCVSQSSRAWYRFMTQFSSYLLKLAGATLSSEADSVELAHSIVIDLFLPDRSGRSRIASYDGRSSLATWLRVLVWHRAINDRKHSHKRLQSVDLLPDIADERVLDQLDADVRARRFTDVVQDSLREACHGLTQRQRLILLLRYDRMLKVQEIAAQLAIHPSNVTRQIERVCKQLRAAVVRILEEKHGMSREAVAECMAELLENPSYSILSLIKSTHCRGADGPVTMTYSNAYPATLADEPFDDGGELDVLDLPSTPAPAPLSMFS